MCLKCGSLRIDINGRHSQALLMDSYSVWELGAPWRPDPLTLYLQQRNQGIRGPLGLHVLCYILCALLTQETFCLTCIKSPSMTTQHFTLLDQEKRPQGSKNQVP